MLQSLTDTYVMVFTSLSLIAAALARPSEWLGARFTRVATFVLLAAVLAVVALTPFLLPYYHARAEVRLGRSLEETQRYSAKLTDYFPAAGRIHFDWLHWSRPYFQGYALFPGFIALALAIIGIATSGIRDVRARMLLVVAAVSFALSFGPAFLPYRVLYRVYPLLTGIRSAVRFGQFTLAAIGMLAGFGIAALQRRLQPRVALVLAAAGGEMRLDPQALRAQDGRVARETGLDLTPTVDRLA